MRQVILFFCYMLFPILGLAVGCGESHSIQAENTMRGDYGGNFDGLAPGAPAKQKGWSGSGEMETGNTSKTVGARADFSEPGTYTVEFSLTPTISAPSGGGSFGILRATATIRWSVEGVTIIRKVTVQDGLSISGVASGVTVDVIDETVVVGVFKLGQTYKVGITIAPGLRASDDVPPILSAPDPTIGNIAHVVTAGSTFIDVPQGAGIKSVWVSAASQTNTAIAEQAIQVKQIGANAKVLAAYDPRSQFFAPLIPGTVKIELANSTADPCVMAVAFGVDG